MVSPIDYFISLHHESINLFLWGKMKRLTVLFAAILCCSLAYSQEAEPETTSGVDFTIIPRLDANPFLAKNNSGGESSFSTAHILYSLFEGSLGDYFTFSVCNHWYGSDLTELYGSPFSCSVNTFTDWANLSLNLGNWTFTGGKNYIFLGTFEEDAYDYDSHFAISTMFWNNFVATQWGGSIAYNLPTEADDDAFVAFQLSTSPFQDCLASHPLKTYTLYLRDQFGPYSLLASAHCLEMDKGENVWMLALGQQLAVNDFTFTVDYMNRYLPSNRRASGRGSGFFGQEMSLTAVAEYNAADNLRFGVKGGWEFCRGINDIFGYGAGWVDEAEDIPYGIEPDKDYLFGGIFAEWYPIDNLRVHALAAVNNYTDLFSFTAGVMYYFNVADLFR